VARGAGVNAYPLRGVAGRPFADRLRVRATGERRELARTQEHFRMHGREIALAATLDRYRASPDFTWHHRKPLPTLLPAWRYEGVQWAMTIDTMICTGCSACMVACQAENNIPVVGADGVRASREMHWIRIDTYFDGPADQTEVIHQPMLCQHCENAPCEYPCPVYATTHSPDGLNEMVYNRCIGTRFCSNNCPYKVRRFNWFEYNDIDPVTRLQRNPNVTVRARGVM
jgi:molybdopterin-containing oxidoreductase family iron-sulfur binding subunit